MFQLLNSLNKNEKDINILMQNIKNKYTIFQK